MSERIIEPSEILTGRQQPKESHTSSVNPWVRLIARFFDYALFFTLLHFIVGQRLRHFTALEHWLPLEFLAWIPIETLLLWSWGKTPGKWLLHTKLQKRYGKKISLDCALRRSFSVWLRGLGMGIPVINAFCMIAAYYRLRTLKTTTWDRDEGIFVTHQSIPRWRLYGTAILALIGLGFYSYWKSVLS